MSTLSTLYPTLADHAKRLDPDGNVADIVEILSQENPVIEHMTWKEGNLPTGHRTTVRTGLPTPTWRKMYGGVNPTKSTTAQVTESCGMLEDYGVVDVALAELNGNTAAFRLSEDKAHIQGMANEFASTLFYGNEGTEPEAFTGLAPRYNDLSAASADNIIDAAGNDSDLTSIYLVVWGDNCHGIFPKGAKAGWSSMDKGIVTERLSDGSRYEAYQTHYKWQCGLSLRDWRYAGRIANIDVSDLNTLSNTKNLVTWMIQLSERIPNFNGRAAWYVPRVIREKLRLGILEKVASNLSWETVEGKRVMTFDDIPVYRTDAILTTETRVV